MTSYKILVAIVCLLLANASSKAQAPPAELTQLVLTVGHSEIISAPGAASTNTRSIQIIKIQSSNPSVATAERYGTNQIQIVAVGPGKTVVQFYDNNTKTQYNQPVWVEAPNATGGGGAGYDPGKTQLPQIVMQRLHTEPIPVPGAGPHQLSSVVSSNPSVATARTDTENALQVYGRALGDTWIDFRDNATGTAYQVHVWVTTTGSLPPAGAGAAPTNGSGAGRGGGSGAAGSGSDAELFNNFNSDGTLNGPRRETVFTLNRPATITSLITYHWNNGRGSVPGTISLRNQRGKTYGPFTASGSSGQGGAANVDWTARANVTLPPGAYTVVDSNPRTWSNNSQSGFAGFAKVRGHFTSTASEPTASQTNLIQNGSFEIGPDPGNFLITYNAGATDIAHWRVTGHTIDYIGPGFWGGSDGNRSVDIDGTPGAGGVAQSFSTTAGQEYLVTFDLAGNPGCPPQVKRLQVGAAGQSEVFLFDVSGKSATSMGWQKKTWRFRANASTTTLEFRSLGDAQGKCGPVIDNVWVVSAR